MASFDTKNTYGKGLDYARFVALVPEAIANMTMALALDTTIDEVAYVLTWTGAGTGTLTFAYQIPGNFQKFLRHSDDFWFTCKQTGDSGDGADIALAVEIYDNAGANISDASLSSAVTSVAAFVERDCAITNPDADGHVSGGDYIYVIITVAGTIENNDILTMSIPIIKYLARH